MAETLRGALEFVYYYPEDERSINLIRGIQMGLFDDDAIKEGIDLAPIKTIKLPPLRQGPGEVSISGLRPDSLDKTMEGVKEGDVNFWERFKGSFGDEFAKAYSGELERRAGLKGKFDVGDLADVANYVLPTVLGTIGAVVGGPGVGTIAVGQGIGTAAGVAGSEMIGSALGVRKHTTMTQEVADPILAGVLAGILSYGVGKGLKYLKKEFPVNQYKKIFKDTPDDANSYLKTSSMYDMKKNDPTGFKELVEAKLARIDDAGNIEVNETLAKEAWERGLRGNAEDMAKKTYQAQLQTELKVRDAVKGQSIKIKNKNPLINLLKDMSEQFKSKFGYENKVTTQADEVLGVLGSTEGDKVPAEAILDARRLIDSARNTSSFKANPNLATSVDDYKVAADQLRRSLAEQIKSIPKLMADYQFNINAFNNLVKFVQKEGNTKAVSAVDAIIIGLSSTQGIPGLGVGTLTTAAKHYVQGSAGITGLARGASAVAKIAEPFTKLGTPMAATKISGTILKQTKPNKGQISENQLNKYIKEMKEKK